MINYQKRMSEEKAILDTEIQQLAGFLANDGLVVKSTIGPPEISYMRSQLVSMQEYSKILDWQIKNFGPTMFNVNDITGRISTPIAQNTGVLPNEEYVAPSEPKVI